MRILPAILVTLIVFCAFGSANQADEAPRHPGTGTSDHTGALTTSTTPENGNAQLAPLREYQPADGNWEGLIMDTPKF